MANPPKDALTEDDYGQLRGKLLKRSMSEGSPITTRDVYVQKVLEPGEGQVAYTIKIIPPRGSGILQPSRRAHVLAFRRAEEGKVAESVILENVLILAVDDSRGLSIQRDAFPGIAITVAVTPQEAEKLAAAKDMGELSVQQLPPGWRSKE